MISITIPWLSLGSLCVAGFAVVMAIRSTKLHRRRKAALVDDWDEGQLTPTDEQKHEDREILGDDWILLYHQLQAVTGDVIRYEILYRFCYKIVEKPAYAGGTYESPQGTYKLSALSLRGVQHILSLFTSRRGQVEAILAKFAKIERPSC